jgi:malonyl CoA-acyl carrier protein transacylase
MRSKGLVQNDCAFAGHSLVEYPALASIADILPIASLVDVVFYRGITMQRAVERDSQNRSNYGMVAANPSRIGKSFGDPALREVVETIARRGNILLEVVKFVISFSPVVIALSLLIQIHYNGIVTMSKVNNTSLLVIWSLFKPLR